MDKAESDLLIAMLEHDMNVEHHLTNGVFIMPLGNGMNITLSKFTQPQPSEGGNG